jgi:glycerol transport system ATP-binding protein
LELANGQPGRHVFPATVTVTEITGSESFVHMTREDLNWVAVLHGVHEFEPGHALDAVLDPDNIFVFETATGRLVASPTNKIT